MDLLNVLVTLTVGLSFRYGWCHEIATDSSHKSFGDFVESSIVKSVVHGLTTDLKEQLNATETKLEKALSEIEKLKLKDKALAEELRHLKDKVQSLCELESTTTPTTTGSTEIHSTTSTVQNATDATIKNSVPTVSQPLTFTSKFNSSATTQETWITSPKYNASNCTIDVMYVLDGSGSIGVSNFSLVKNWVKSSARRLTTQYPTMQLGVMQYSHLYANFPLEHPLQKWIRTEVKLAYRVYNDFAVAVDKISLMGYTTYTAAALRLVKNDFVGSENFNRTGNVQIMILVTDGSATDADSLPQSAKDLRSIGVIPFMIGVGNANVTELRTIATGDPSNSDRVTRIPDFPDLEPIRLDSKHLRNC